jgi:hypothetical protein
MPILWRTDRREFTASLLRLPPIRSKMPREAPKRRGLHAMLWNRLGSPGSSQERLPRCLVLTDKTKPCATAQDCNAAVCVSKRQETRSTPSLPATSRPSGVADQIRGGTSFPCACNATKHGKVIGTNSAEDTRKCKRYSTSSDGSGSIKGHGIPGLEKIVKVSFS